MIFFFSDFEIFENFLEYFILACDNNETNFRYKIYFKFEFLFQKIFDMNQYRLVKKIGEGAFAEVLQAKNLKTGKYVAIKCMKNHFKSREQVNSLPEIYALKKLCPKANPNPNIVQLNDALYDEPTGRLALVFELMDMNMYEVIKGRRSYIQEKKVKH